MTSTSLPVPTTAPSCGGHLVTVDGRTLPLRETRLVARAAGGIATVKVVQTFTNAFAEVLQVRYLLPLPADAAVAGFAFMLGDRRIHGQIDRRAAARERFERALVAGRTAALLEQERSSLFTQELGNVPAGATIVAEIEVDQPLAWVDGQWEWRFPTTVAPRYLGAAGRVGDGGRIDVPVADAPVAKALQVELTVADGLAAGSAITSPSHALHGEAAIGGASVRIAAPTSDRDVVVRWRVATPEVGVGLRTSRPVASAGHANEAYGLLTLVPPSGAALGKQARDLIVLLDISGSMSGQPLAAAQAVTAELIRSLDAADRLELIAFASRPTPWLGAPCFATEGNKAAALQWLYALRAGGGTEMRDAILAALQPLREHAQRQVVLVTDGQIGFEAEITAEIRNRLPAASRVHVVGVGSAPNRSLTRSAARAGAGVEVLIGVAEDPAPAAKRLLERTVAPLVTNLRIGGTALLATAPHALPDLFAGAPARLGLRLRPEGGTLAVSGESAAGTFRHAMVLPPIAAGEGEASLSRLVGREWVEDLETAIAASDDVARHLEPIERIGLSFGIATRATSWIAIDEQVGVDPREARRIVEVPHELPHGMSMQGLGLRPACVAAGPAASVVRDLAAESFMEKRVRMAPPAAAPLPAPEAAGGPPPKAKRSLLGGLFGKKDAADMPPPPPPHIEPSAPLGLLRLRDADVLVFELLGLATWTPPKRVVLVFADGSEFTVEVLHDRTTRAGNLGSGVAVQLVVRATSNLPAGRPTLVRLGERRDAPTVRLA